MIECFKCIFLIFMAAAQSFLRNGMFKIKLDSKNIIVMMYRTLFCHISLISIV